jgi:thiamine pyrophosphokinase
LSPFFVKNTHFPIKNTHFPIKNRSKHSKTPISLSNRSKHPFSIKNTHFPIENTHFTIKNTHFPIKKPIFLSKIAQNPHFPIKKPLKLPYLPPKPQSYPLAGTKGSLVAAAAVAVARATMGLAPAWHGTLEEHTG